MPIPSGPERDTEAQLPGILSAFLSGADGADDRLCSVLYKPVIDSVRAFLGRDNQDVDDVVQESLVAVLGYLRKRGEFEGNLVRFAVTIARNRCRNILIWRRRHPQIHIDPRLIGSPRLAAHPWTLSCIKSFWKCCRMPCLVWDRPVTTLFTRFSLTSVRQFPCSGTCT